MLTTSFLACTAPRAVAPAMNDRMYRDAATQANLETLRERGVIVIEPDEGALASRGEHGVGRLPAPERLLPEVEALLPGRSGPVGRPAGPGHRGRHPRADRLACASSATARAGGWASRSPSAAAAPRRRGDAGRRQRHASRSPPACSGSTSRRAAELAAAVRDGVPGCRRAADGRRRRRLPPGGRGRRGRSRERGGGPRLRLEATEDILAALGARAASRARRWSASRPSTARRRSSAPATKLERKGVDAIVFNDVSRAEIGFDSEPTR